MILCDHPLAKSHLKLKFLHNRCNAFQTWNLDRMYDAAII